VPPCSVSTTTTMTTTTTTKEREEVKKTERGGGKGGREEEMDDDDDDGDEWRQCMVVSCVVDSVVKERNPGRTGARMCRHPGTGWIKGADCRPKKPRRGAVQSGEWVVTQGRPRSRAASGRPAKPPSTEARADQAPLATSLATSPSNRRDKSPSPAQVRQAGITHPARPP